MTLKNFSSSLFLLIILMTSCVSSPPEKPDNICDIFQEKRSWYKAAIKTEKRWKLPPYVLMAIIHQESSFQAKVKPEREKLFGVIPWLRPSSAVGYSQALKETWQDYKDETSNKRASRTNFADSADFIGWYSSKGFYQGLAASDARSLYLAYHEGYAGFKMKTYRKKMWLVAVADRVSLRSQMYQKQYWGCEKELKKKRFFFF
ncbi:transglycosylase SLT domain-containing protein [Pseudomonadota bacterium]|nr:transglycosylase SLT domain-containing protein [Pseudomonadota bacterium]